MSAAAKVEVIYTRLMRAGSGAPFNASDACSADGETLFFIGTVCGGTVFAGLHSIVYRVTQTGELVALHQGPAKLLELAPDGARIAFAVADRETGRDRLVVMTEDGAVDHDIQSDGRIEQVDWSPDGTALLVLVAGAGTDTTTLAGSTGTDAGRAIEPWRPAIDDGTPDPEDWRRLSVYRLGEAGFDPSLSVKGMIWEASWTGDAAIAVLLSERSGEAAWYRAVLAKIDLPSLGVRTLYVPQDQIGQVRGSPDGSKIAFIEGVASDRGLVCGPLKSINADGSQLKILATDDIEITAVTWRGPALHLAGQRGLVTVIGDHDLSSNGFRERWFSDQWSCGAYVPVSRPVGADGAVAIMESQTGAPRLALIGDGAFETIIRFADGDDRNDVITTPIRWVAPDGLEVEGLLVRPADANGPMPTVVDIHGGPVWAYRARWEGRQRATPALVAAGFAVLYPNPRGSFGRGQDFARRVHGDMGGADTGDILSGIDHLVAQGVADPARIGLTGSSYGGYMSAWLPKLRPQIAAAVSISPVANWFSQHFTSNMPVLEEIFIGGSPGVLGQEYLARSPAMSKAKTQAATLILAGALDRCTPIGQAIELHRALLEQGSTSVLVTYPQEGHSVRSPRGFIDSATRTLDWFCKHMAP
ncbi:prolyl oligopeptidase family serine peptidase [Sphingomonas sp. Leaf208]|uniref:S9 family peptidase n=1 Tax=Sphingomonas sp. Leaf208 TaxID=1735679 RepID=UPI000B0DABD3|nr:prolyl oligopeptidase family serine peptidase [Sphingomonas sp. Leaf208]